MSSDGVDDDHELTRGTQTATEVVTQEEMMYEDIDLEDIDRRDDEMDTSKISKREEEKGDVQTEDERFNRRVSELIGKLNVGREEELSTDESEDFKINAYVLYVRVKKWLKELEADKMLLRQNQRMLSLKYHGLKKKIDFVQISVIAVASCITFIDSVQQYIELHAFFRTIFPIVLSTYIGFIIAVARLYKWDDTKETLTKMNEKLAIVINQLWQKIKFGYLHKNIEPSLQWREYFKSTHEKLDDYDKDGLMDQVVQLKQEIDVIMNYSEKLKYKNLLASLSLRDAVIQKKIKTVDSFKDEILLDNRRIPQYPKYKLLAEPVRRIRSYFGSANDQISKTRFFEEHMFN